MYKLSKNLRTLKSAVLALQCATRVKIAKTELKGLMGEQKNIGKLRDNNEKLKQEMQSLKAMLNAQAKEGAASAAHAAELQAKQTEIDSLEKRVAELEKELATEQALIEKMEADLKTQKQATMEAASRAPLSPRSPQGRKRISGQSPMVRISAADVDGALQMPNLPSNYVSPEIVAQHKAKLYRLEDELTAERKLRREADGEIIKLRAQINGVQLNDGEVDALLAQKLEAAPKVERYVYYCMLDMFVFDCLSGCRKGGVIISLSVLRLQAIISFASRVLASHVFVQK
jgi:myosin heavy subunit